MTNIWRAAMFCAVLCVCALAFVGCAKQDSAEVLQARADRQEAQWQRDEAREQLETSSQQYQALMAEFAAFQNDHDCRAKK